MAIVDEAAQRGQHFVLVDNHLTARPILTVIGTDGVRTLPKEVWPHVHDVRRAVHAAIEELSPPEWSFVFTNYLLEGEPGSMHRLQRLAGARDCAYMAVVLRCADAQRLERVVTTVVSVPSTPTVTRVLVRMARSMYDRRFASRISNRASTWAKRTSTWAKRTSM